MNSSEKTAAWLGVAASLVAVLAFFGITDLDSLQEAVGKGSGKSGTPSPHTKDSALSGACEIAYAADKALYGNLGTFDGERWTNFEAGWTTYATQMEAAAVRTTDKTLQVYLREDKRQAEVLISRHRAGVGTGDAGTVEIQAKHAWMDYCRKHGVRRPLL
ncbi:hypothetical protein [Streptomyces olivaceoviridis]